MPQQYCYKRLWCNRKKNTVTTIEDRVLFVMKEVCFNEVEVYFLCANV